MKKKVERFNDIIMHRYVKLGICFQLSVYENVVKLDLIVVPKNYRKQKVGTTILKELVCLLDENNLMCELTPSTSLGATSTYRLRKFYKRFGFVENKGKNKNFTISEGMYRLPKTINNETR